MGQLGGRAVDVARVAHEVQQGRGGGAVLSPGAAPEAARRAGEGDVVEDAERTEQARGLVGAGDAGPGDGVGRRPGEVAVSEADPSR